MAPLEPASSSTPVHEGNSIPRVRATLEFSMYTTPDGKWLAIREGGVRFCVSGDTAEEAAEKGEQALRYGGGK